MIFLNNIFSPGVEIFFVIDSPYLWTVEETGYKKWRKKFVCDTDQIVFLRILGNGSLLHSRFWGVTQRGEERCVTTLKTAA